jgi:hypothetical protein
MVAGKKRCPTTPCAREEAGKIKKLARQKRKNEKVKKMDFLTENSFY